MNVLAIGAHPDDCEYGCFGTLAKHLRNGDKVHLACVTYGTRGVVEDRPLRIQESVEAAHRLGVDDYKFLGFTVFEVAEVDPDVIDSISGEIDRVKPQRIYTLSQYDTNQVHWTVSKCTRIAARYVDEILHFETASTIEEFSPTMYVDITDFIDNKIHCLNAHESQLRTRPYLREEFVRTLGAFRHLKSRLSYLNGAPGYAEAFMVERMIA